MDGSTATVGAGEIQQMLARSEFFWLDLSAFSTDTATLLSEQFAFHPLAVEDAEKFGQRPKIEDFDGYTYFVLYGAGEDSSQPMEVHAFLSERFVVTVHQGPCASLERVRDRLARHRREVLSPPQVAVLYLVVDELVDSFFPLLASLDDRIDEVEDDILASPTDAQLSELFSMKRSLVALRKVVTPQRDMFAGLLAGVNPIEGMSTEDERYFRDIYDHLIRISDLVDSYRDLLSGAMDTHLATVSNRLNVVMKQLAVIATVFLPLSFLTGFFGQNFSVLVNHFIVRAWTFWVFGIGLESAAVVVMVVYFRRQGWVGRPRRSP